jgi:uncharacterized membrane protein YkvA (DUF1232 family)
MAEIFATLRLLIGGGFVLLIVFLVLLASPASRLRDVVMPFVKFGIAILAIFYICSPVDFAPELLLGPAGMLDDAVALAVAIGSARSGVRSLKHLTWE